MVSNKRYTHLLSTLIFCFVLVAPIKIKALEKRPWFFAPWHIQTGVNANLSYFGDVDNGYNPFDYRSTNGHINAYLLVPFLPTWDAEIELGALFTRKTKNFGSLALQVRKQFLDDISGDFISLDGGLSFRYVPKKNLRDVAVPYHGELNFELFSSIGKEFSNKENWRLRTFLFGAVGQANKGSPWLSCLYDITGRLRESFLLGAFVDGYFGLGKYTLINVSNFNSYANFAHRSVDIGISFAYEFPVNGTLKLEYQRRAYARSYPRNYNSIVLHYNYPLSF